MEKRNCSQWDYHRKNGLWPPLFQIEVLAGLAALVFSLPGLSWAPTQHAEFFSGKMEVTLAEIQDLQRLAQSVDEPWRKQKHIPFACG